MTGVALNAEMSFEEWVRKVFDHPFDPKNPWYLQADAEMELVPPATYVHYGTRLFRESAHLLREYSEGQANEGLYALISNTVSDNIFAIRDETIPVESRANFLRSIYELNRQCFEVRCTPHLSHLDYKGTPENVSPLNEICYMWWDVSIIYGETKDLNAHLLNEACLWVMENALQLSNPAVLEGALHGLGHWQRSHPQRCEAAIDRFLAKRANEIYPELRAYAQAARTGCIQ